MANSDAARKIRSRLNQNKKTPQDAFLESVPIEVQLEVLKIAQFADLQPTDTLWAVFQAMGVVESLLKVAPNEMTKAISKLEALKKSELDQSLVERHLQEKLPTALQQGFQDWLNQSWLLIILGTIPFSLVGFISGSWWQSRPLPPQELQFQQRSGLLNELGDNPQRYRRCLKDGNSKCTFWITDPP